MKKLISFIVLSICFSFLFGCSTINQILDKTKDKISSSANQNSVQENSTNQKENTDSTETTKNETPNYSIKDIYPFKANTKYEYEGKGNEYASYTVWVDYIKDDKIQLRTDNGGTVVASVLQLKDGELKTVFLKEEAYYREDFTSKQSNKDEIILKEPLVKGTSWTLSDGRKRYISNVDVDVTVPAGSFKAIEVTTEGKDYKNLDYYAQNTGLIKTVYISGDMEVTSSLSKITENSSFTENVKFYYPNINDEKIYYTEKKLTFKTNDITKITFEKILKESPGKGLGAPLSKNAKIKSLYLNNDVVYVDFSKEFVSEMNAGSGYEAMILDSIVNTLGEYYGVTKVYITVENKPYSSGHIQMKKGETFKVNTKNTVKIK
ncbi:GerMN domain-containing protein [Clostridium sp. SYSU_GA19001]|uniref:GerMN domain-containing protein n=1 Tax=Clostridium caldaquaticum TaxID=2940653 RepID=UPI0020771AEF|nr:GerMN domain-containing protein [Clostridium caldaquaticum]MCM8710285.1 GerMN domain-containing protein [Clostridium caldaquaticum]